MKKIILVFLLAFIVSTSVFAARPSGWGVGIVGQYGFAWDGFTGAPGAGLSLKAPQLPIYYGIHLDLRRYGFGVSLTGDRYLIDNTLSSDVNLGWFLGWGTYIGVFNYRLDSTSWTSIRTGLRLPIGLYIFPVNFLELFINLAPSLGVGLYFGDHNDRFRFPEGGLGLDIGLRFWL